MGNKNPIAMIGGYDSIAKSFYSKTKLLNNKSIFINVDSIKRKKSINILPFSKGGSFQWIRLQKSCRNYL